jgi:hypothetical protein
MSIGSNDMTQLALGLDRDSGVVAKLFDERDDAVKALMAMAIKACKAQGKYVGICGQGPSDHPELARWLVEQGIDSLSLNPDTVVETWMFLALRTDLEAAQQPLAVELEFADRLAHVVQRQVRRALLERLRDLRRPALRQLLERAHVEIAIVKESLEVGMRRARKRRSWQMLLPHIGERPGSAQARRNSSVSRSAAAVSIRLASTRAINPELPCCLRFQSSMASSTISL